MPTSMNMLSQPVRSYPVHSAMMKFCHIRSLLLTVSQHSVALHTKVSSQELWRMKRGIPLCTRGWVHSLGTDWLLAQEWLYQCKYILAHFILRLQAGHQTGTAEPVSVVIIVVCGCYKSYECLTVQLKMSFIMGWADIKRMGHQCATDSPEQHSSGFEVSGFLSVSLLYFDLRPKQNAIQGDAPEGSDTFQWQLCEEIAWAEIGWWNGTS